jgi:hypothetical protein
MSGRNARIAVGGTVSLNSRFFIDRLSIMIAIRYLSFLSGRLASIAFCATLAACGGSSSTSPTSPSAATGLYLLAGAIDSAGSADGQGAAARFNNPGTIAVDATGNLYVSELRGVYTNGDLIAGLNLRKVTPDGTVSTLASAGTWWGSTDPSHQSDQFSIPSGMTFDTQGNLYIVDKFHYVSGEGFFRVGGATLRKVTPSGSASLIAGESGSYGHIDGTGTQVRFSPAPGGITHDAAGNLYIADGDTIRKATPDGTVSTLATGVSEPSPVEPVLYGIALDAGGNLYASTGHNTIRKVTPAGVVMTLAGMADVQGSVDGIGSSARFGLPGAMTIDPAGNLYVSDVRNATIRKVAPDGTVSTVAGTSGQPGIRLGSLPGGLSPVTGLAYVAPNTLVVVSGNALLKLVLPQ